KFDQIYKELRFLLNDEQKNLVETILDDDEISSLLQEVIIIHETKSLEKAIKLYEDILSYLNKMVDKEETKNIVFDEMIELLKDFHELAMEEKSLSEYVNIEIEYENIHDVLGTLEDNVKE